jgi:hypothetical protein
MQLRLFLAALAGVAVLMFWLSHQGRLLRTAHAPHGIVSYELAGTAGRAGAILTDWKDPTRRRVARLQLTWDYLFIIAYASALWLGAGRAAHAVYGAKSPVLAATGPWVRWLGPAAGVLDAAENTFLLHMLAQGAADGASARAAAVCAGVKFLLSGVGLLYSLPGLPSALAAIVRGRLTVG